MATETERTTEKFVRDKGVSKGVGSTIGSMSLRGLEYIGLEDSSSKNANHGSNRKISGES